MYSMYLQHRHSEERCRVSIGLAQVLEQADAFRSYVCSIDRDPQMTTWYILNVLRSVQVGTYSTLQYVLYILYCILCG
jgi:hypothetical protein